MQLNYEIDKKKFSELKNNIVIPKFQRGLVWGETKKIEFIKTLKEGNPIGVLLLYRENEESKYQVIDGLQRFTTMMDYSLNYFNYVGKEEITDSNIGLLTNLNDTVGKLWDDLLPEKQTKVKEQIREIFVECLKKRKDVDNLLTLSQSISSKLSQDVSIFARESENLLNTVYTLVSTIDNNQSIDDIEIPLIIYKGNKEELANIFQKLNQEGVKLSKYDVFAATWIDYYVHVDNQDIKRAIIDKYVKAEDDANLDISDFDAEEIEETGQLTVFEYAYALGKHIQNKCPILFTSIDDSKIDSIGFLILTELVGLSYQNMGDLAKKLAEEYRNVAIDDLTDAVIGCCEQVADSLQDYLASPASKAKGKKKPSLACHSELQLVSYIIVLFKYKYSMTASDGIKETGKNKEEIRKVLTNLPCHYLYDIIRGYWAGSGDSKLEAIINGSLDSCRYLLKPSKESFEHEVRSWLINENEKPVSKSVTKLSKLFWTYILRNNGISSKTQTYDVEHCVPQDVIKKYLIQNHIDVPISTPCNLCYIPPRDNRQKKSETYYQFIERVESAYTLNDSQLEKYVYPSRSDLDFVNSSDSITKENYRDFLNSRVDIIVNQIIECFYQ